MRFSIRHKILAVLGILLLVAICCYTVLASFIFHEQKSTLLFDLNHSIAVNTSSQLRTFLFQVKNQLKLYSISEILTDSSRLKLPPDFLNASHVLSMGLWKNTDGGFSEQKLSANLPPLSVEREKLLSSLPTAMEKEVALFHHTDLSKPLHFLLATKIEIQINNQNEGYAAVAEIDGKYLFETLQSTNIFKSYLVNDSGEVLIHCDRNILSSAPNIANHPLLATALKHPTTSGISPFQFEGENWYGAYAPVQLGGLFFISQANRSEVTAAIFTLIQRSLLFGVIVVTLTFIASILFSKKLTSNLNLLTLSAKKIEKGDLDSKINIRSHDEIQELASSFNAMMDSLKSSRLEIERYARELEALNQGLEDKVAKRTSELEIRNATLKEVQEKLLKATQLAAVGEVAGRTAHELLNPLTAIISRLERSRHVVQTAGTGGKVASMALPLQLAEIIKAWENDYNKGGMEQLNSSLTTKSAVNPELTLIEEDLDNLKKLAQYWRKQTEVLGSDLDFVHEQSHRIHRIIDKMRELSRESVKAEVYCHKALAEAIQTMSDFLKKHGVALESRLEASDDISYLNKDELIQIVTNLIRNSYDAINKLPDAEKRKKGQISLVTSNKEGILFVDVTDNGIGIPHEAKNRIFEQGFTSKPPSEGTGLGLAICRRYAHAFGGEVELLFSEPETKGTGFRVTVPLKEQKIKMAS